uniref:Transcription factor Iwr1 domain-containing protein n=1 Tax=Manihot esculenta TaxID=3983 RepID=A0A251JML1_MANES
MASVSGSTSSPPKCTSEKPVVVRVKRKSNQSRLDAFWLEINERPLKRPLLDFEKLSIDCESGHGKVEELKTKKVFVQHVETVNSTEATIDILQSFVPNSTDAVEVIPKSKERKQIFRKDNKQEQLLSKARKNQEILAQNARFEQIWRSRRGNKETSHDKELRDMCHFYDIVRVDVEERSNELQDEVMSLEDQRILSSYLPLLREFIPSAAAQIETDVRDYMSKQDDYVYDYYTIRDDMDIGDEDSLSPFPLVQVEDEDFYDGLDDESEYESDDSNAEDHPRNDYPDEISEEEDEVEEESEASSGELEDADDASSTSSESEKSRHGLSEDAVQYEDGIYDDEDAFDYEDDDNFDYDDDDGDDDGNAWR